MGVNPRLPAKKDVALALLEQSTLYVHLDPRNQEVRVPPWFKKQPQLVLQVGLNMAIPIPDLNVSDEGISCTLSFNRSPHFCWIPWGSVFALVGENGRAMVWPDDVPKEVAAQSAQQQQKKEGPRLHSVPAEEPKAAQPSRPPAKPAAAATASEDSEKLQKKKPRRAKKETGISVTDGSRTPSKPPVSERPRPAPALSASEPPAVAPAPRDSAPADSKRKRDLPPYLRVIK
ncbi:MAG TPA: ClpXP protease specificity-enhancing factor SspB [Polyangiaceae bacterium]|nr:ClpXP protease specificity-enhancing factor SspB [Polyangiaceae bacterium]